MKGSERAAGAAQRAGAATGRLWAGVSGALLALAYPRADWGLLALVALIPFLLSLQSTDRAAALLRGYVCGATFFAILLYWIPGVMETYGGLPLPVAWLLLALLVFYLATFFALFAWLVSAAWRRHGPIALAFAPVSWVALEIARARLLTGFPWGLLGYSQYRNPSLLQASAWGGIHAVSFLVMAANAGGALLILRPAGTRVRIAGAVLIAVLGLSWAGGALAMRPGDRREAGDAGGAIRVAAVQANVRQDLKWDPRSAAGTLSDLSRLSREAASSGARLIVWPESSSPLSVRRPRRDADSGTAIQTDETYATFLGDLARSLNADLIVGSIDYRVAGGELRAYNSALAVGADGTLGATYDKVHLVPFGEYVPLARVLFFVNRMVGGAIAEFAAGTRLEPLPTSAGRAGTIICYEAIFPEVVRRVAGHDADFLVNITNDAWFGRTAAPYQHASHLILRAIETRMGVARAANDGISEFVDPLGRVTQPSGLQTQTVVTGTLRTSDVRPLYVRWGDWVGLLTVLATLAFAGGLVVKRGRWR